MQPNKKPPIKLTLEEWRVVESLYAEFDEHELTSLERHTRNKIRKIISCIEISMAKNAHQRKEENSNDNSRN